MYRILAAHAEVRERRQQRQHSVYRKPELLGTQSGVLGHTGCVVCK
jgi:hypothetical protein